MKYPRLPEELDDRRKLNAIQIEEIKKLYNESWSQTKLAKEFNVSRKTIYYHLVGTETRKEINQKRAKEIAEQKINDPEFALKHRQQSIKSYINGYKKLEARRVYKGKETYKWKKKKYHADEAFRLKVRQQANIPSVRARFRNKWKNDPVYREWKNESNKRNYIKINLTPPQTKIPLE